MFKQELVGTLYDKIGINV